MPEGGVLVSSSIKGHNIIAHSHSTLKVGESFSDVCGFGKISRDAGDGNRTQLLSSARKAETQTRLLSGQLSHTDQGWWQLSHADSGTVDSCSILHHE